MHSIVSINTGIICTEVAPFGDITALDLVQCHRSRFGTYAIQKGPLMRNMNRL